MSADDPEKYLDQSGEAPSVDPSITPPRPALSDRAFPQFRPGGQGVVAASTPLM
ncbi:hypothetical protein ACFXP3_33615 [Streptomyces sp. NPDC059096]|uniref:hypothetical protein n=1 Tax=Streptomyces sp. NPDC059096 TaxID=3346727 RepID=UPI0036BB2E06